MMEQKYILKPCPFCGESEKIKFSLKRTGRFEVQYHAAMYCDNCHTYGPRVLTPKVKHNDYKGRAAMESNEEIRKQAKMAWNTRKPIDDIVERMDKAAYRTGGRWERWAIDLTKAVEIVRKDGTE